GGARRSLGLPGVPERAGTQAPEGPRARGAVPQARSLGAWWRRGSAGTRRRQRLPGRVPAQERPQRPRPERAQGLRRPAQSHGGQTYADRSTSTPSHPGQGRRSSSMTDAEWRGIAAVLTATWPSSRWPEETQAIYRTKLDGIPVSDLARAIDKLVETSEFLPSIAAILGQYRKAQPTRIG